MTFVQRIEQWRGKSKLDRTSYLRWHHVIDQAGRLEYTVLNHKLWWGYVVHFVKTLRYFQTKLSEFRYEFSGLMLKLIPLDSCCLTTFIRHTRYDTSTQFRPKSDTQFPTKNGWKSYPLAQHRPMLLLFSL